MPTILLTFVILTVISIGIWISAWTYIRWQRIWKHSEKEWFNKLFWITTLVAAVVLAATIIIWAVLK